MSKLRKQVLQQEEDKKFDLSSYEFQYLKDMQNVLMFHTLRSNLISGFLTYVATTRLGYTQLREGYALQYEVDLKGNDHTLIVREVKKPLEDDGLTD